MLLLYKKLLYKRYFQQTALKCFITFYLILVNLNLNKYFSFSAFYS